MGDTECAPYYHQIKAFVGEGGVFLITINLGFQMFLRPSLFLKREGVHGGLGPHLDTPSRSQHPFPHLMVCVGLACAPLPISVIIVCVTCHTVCVIAFVKAVCGKWG